MRWASSQMMNFKKYLHLILDSQAHVVHLLLANGLAQKEINEGWMSMGMYFQHTMQCQEMGILLHTTGSKL
eukprot:4886174-Ditylum_brightwellii.AAC.1